MFDFRDMLLDYSKKIYILNKTEGQWNTSTGIYEPGTTTKLQVFAPVLPLSNDDLVNDQGGQYTRQDRKIYIHQELIQGQEVEIDSEVWKVMAVKDYAFHANELRIAIVRKVGEVSD